jgi:hypothetical protein
MATAVAEQIRETLPEHLIGLPGADWAFWRWICLRGAGFPACDVLKLGASRELIKTVEQVRKAEHSVHLAREKASQSVMSALDDLRRTAQWDDKPRRVALLKAKDKLRAGQVPRSALPAELKVAIEELQLALQGVADSRTAFRCAYSDFAAHSSELLREVARSPRFREAVIWQNRTAVHTGLDCLLRGSDGRSTRNSRQRQNEEMVASYLQRYCIKNDTIGFFGPVGWARFVQEGSALVLRPGPALLSKRTVYFEAWPIEALAKVIARDPAVYPALAPILMPFIRVEGQRLHHPIYGPMQISPEQRAVLCACDGRTTAKQIADAFRRLPGGRFSDEKVAYGILSELAAKRIVYWDFIIPLGPHPETALEEALQKIPDHAVRQRSFAMLDELESAREVVQAATGNVERLDAALEILEQTFTRLTDVSATRAKGKTYAGRTLVYEDCRRDAEVLLGPELLESVGRPLSLLLQSARWLTSQIAATYKNKFREIYSALAQSTGRKAVDASLFWVQLLPHLDLSDGNNLSGPIQQEFQAKWNRILGLRGSNQPLRYSSEELRELVEAEFPVADPGWPGAHYACPDIMIAAASEDAVCRGDYLLVMGEFHLGGNTLNASLFVNQHPFPEQLIRNVEQDLGIPNVVPVQPKDSETPARTSSSLISPKDFRLEYALDSFAQNRSLALPVSSLVIDDEKGVLLAKTVDGRLRFNAMDLVGGRLSDLVVDSFKMMAPSRHSPRVLIDRMVIKRESWRFSPSELLFAQEQDAAERFLLAQNWAKDHSMPRFVFFKVPVERKPSYVDFQSPILIDIFSRMIRRTIEAGIPKATVDVSEMLPSADHLWLSDAEGTRYTSELRIVTFWFAEPHSKMKNFSN